MSIFMFPQPVIGDAKFGTKNDKDTSELSYVLTGSMDRVAIYAYALTNIPSIDGHRASDSLKIKFLGEGRDGTWLATANYKGATIKQDEDEPVDPENPPTAKEKSVGVSFAGNTEKVFESLETVAMLDAPGETAPDFGGLINVNKDGKAEGLDVNPQSMAESTFSVDLEVPTSAITNEYISNVFSVVRRTNTVPFRGFGVDEVMFWALRTQVENGALVSTLSFDFLVRKRKENLTVGVFGSVDKAPWDYLWVYKAKRKDATTKRTFDVPIGLYVEKLFFDDNFQKLGVPF